MNAFICLDRFHDCLENCQSIQVYGRVSRVVGFTVESIGPECRLGTVCDIFDKDGERRFPAEVMGFKDNRVLLMPLEEIHGIGPGSRVVARQTQASIPVGRHLLGRVLDGIGNPIDGQGPIQSKVRYPIYAQPPNPLKRKRISEPLDLGIRAINGLLTIGCGQRIGIFAGSGVGKSILLGMIAKATQADVNVIALIGERGRELNDFIAKQLGEEGLRRSVIVVATSDHLPLIRMRGAFIATAVAEYFRDQGLKVNLMMDSVTRFAMAQREIGLSLGEPPTTKGYTPSVFTLLPKLMERAGTSANRGSITGLYTVLVEGDDTNEPIADAIRSILDGHIVLTRELAMQGHYPAIDVSRSISRVMDDIISEDHRVCAQKLKRVLATYRRTEDLINIGAYAAGSNPDIDYAIQMVKHINAYLRQDVDTTVPLQDSIAALLSLFE
jgi:flagellum-specific ATP synthase